MKKIALLTCTLILFSLCVKCQNLQAPTDLLVIQSPSSDVIFDHSIGDTLSDPIFLFEENENMKFVVSFVVSDTSNISNIHVKVGSSVGAGDIANTAFSFDSTPAAGLSYFRDGSSIVLEVGQHALLEECFCEVYLEDIHGNLSSVATYASN